VPTNSIARILIYSEDRGGGKGEHRLLR